LELIRDYMGSYNPGLDPAGINPDIKFRQMLQAQQQQNLINQIAQQGQQLPPQIEPPGPVTAPPAGTPQNPTVADVAQAHADVGNLPGTIPGAPANAPPGSPALPPTPPPQMAGSQPVAPPPPAAPSPLEEYQNQLLQRQKAVDAATENIINYHPSVGRRILATTLGAFAGIGGHPEMGSMIRTAGTPQQKALDLAQKRLETAQQAFGTVAETEKIKGEAQRTKYEGIRAQAEANKAAFEISPEGFQQKLRLAQAAHEKYMQFEGVDDQGQPHSVLLDVQGGQMLDAATMKPITPGQYQTIKDVPTVRQEMIGQQAAAKTEGAKEIARMRIQADIDKIGLKGDEAIRVGNALEAGKHVDRLSEIQARGAENLKAIEERAKNPTIPATLRTMAGNAKVALDMIPDMDKEIDSLADSLGKAKGRWNDFYVNKVGGDNGPFAHLDETLTLFASSLAQAHYGTRGTSLTAHMMQQFREAQSPEDLKQRIKAAETILKDRARVGGIPELPAGGPGPVKAPPQPGVDPTNPMNLKF
jgi:hypothetical protein